MRDLRVFLLAVFSCIALCGCDSARSSRDPASAVPSESTPASAPPAPTMRSITLTIGKPSDVEISGPGSEVLVVHVRITQEGEWDPFSVRVQDVQGTALGAFVVPYGQDDASFPLRLKDPELVGLKATERVTLRAVPHLVRSGGVFPHSVQLQMEFRSEP